MRAIALAAAANQITVIVTESVLFAPLRRTVKERSGYLGELVSCHLCFGTWVGLLMALAFQPRWIGRRRRGEAASAIEVAVSTIADGFALAFFGRLLNELTAKVQREVKILDQTVERLEEASDDSAPRRDGEPIARHP